MKTSKAYQLALSADNATIDTFWIAIDAYHEGRIDDEAYCKAYKVREEAKKVFDEAFAIEAGWKD